MRSIFWLASYPRSGNTYLRALVGNYLHANGEPLSINSLAQVTIGEHKEEIWEEITGKPAAERTVDDEWIGRAAYYERLRASPGEGPLLVKTHTLDGAYKGAPAFQFRPGDRVIHLVRHPGDVAVSSADFYGIDLDEAIDRLVRPGLLIDGRPSTGFEVLGSWEQHTRSWVDERQIPILTVRYFELHERPQDLLNIIMPFLGLRPDPKRVADAAEFARFERLRAQEEKTGFIEGSTASTSGRFFREGRPLQWREVLSPEQAERLIAPNRALLDQLGITDFVETRSQTARTRTG